MRRTAPAGPYCECGLSNAVPVGHRLHKPWCSRARAAAPEPELVEPPEQRVCRERTEEESAVLAVLARG